MMNISSSSKTTGPPAALCLFSLKIDGITFETIPPDTIDNIATTLKQRGAKIINIESTEINATFQTVNSCMTSAVTIVQNILQTAREFDRPVCFVKIGLHITEDIDTEEHRAMKHFDRSITACGCAEPNEIIITADFYRRLSPQVRNACKKKTCGSGSNLPFYSLPQTRSPKTPSSVSDIIPSGKIVQDRLPCFYCGATAHVAGQCPSKPIPDSTDYLNRLGYIPLTRIEKIFRENFAEIIRPLKKGSDEERFENLYSEREITPFSTAFFSFYELSEIFQLRSLRRLYIDTFENPKAQKTGALRMGQDCLRVSRFSEAEEWFHKASVENPNDYRPVVSRGLLYIEKEDPKAALAQFRMALSFSITDDQKVPIRLFCARTFEISGALEEALEEIVKALQNVRGWKEASYYHAVILAKLRQFDAAADIFRKLSYANPKYLLMTCIDPAINSIRSEIGKFLDSEISHFRSRAIESYAGIKKNMEKYQKWLKAENRDHQRIYEIYQKASSILQNESLAGIAEIPDLEHEITALIRRYILEQKDDLQKKIHRFSKKPSAFLKYLNAFPYPFVISAKDFQIGKKFQSVYVDAVNAAQIVTPQSLETAQKRLQALTAMDKNVKMAEDRLETVKMFIFICEYLFKMLRFFLVSALLSSLFFFAGLFLFQAVMAPAVLESIDYMSFFRYGFFAGVVVGILSTGIWVKKSLSGMLSKITKT